MENHNEVWKKIGLRYKSHPWHGVDIGEFAPKIVNSFIECVPSDTLKYELDKETGYLKIDRPQKFSSLIPALYGFIPRTYCGDLVAEYCNQQTGRKDITGDGDPLDICVLCERNITHGDLLVQAVPIGGFRMIDGGEADDKIIAVLKEDEVYQNWRSINDCPSSIVARLKHYFLTYKDMPGQKQRCEITHTYDIDEAYEVIRRSIQDYKEKFGKLDDVLSISVMEAFTDGLSIMRNQDR